MTDPASPTSGPAEEKGRLRARMRAFRRSLSPQERLRLALAVEEHLFAIPEVAGAGTILLFYSFGSEVETSEMGRRVLAAGKRLLLPYLETETMEAAEVLPDDPLVETDYGPREPSRRAAVHPEEVDVVVAPGLAFDRRGYRLGYGGGHYDRYLARLGSRGLRVGIGFSGQLVDRVPREPSDERLHLVVTEAGVIDCRNPPRSAL